ncbi:MAG: hypothetical protein MI723_05480, partial [Caulobacterales bacterium]|nr:hypothetical protein [Caulobacterales bacterium]
MRRHGRQLIAAGAAALATGCVGTVRHNDTLLFGTNTKVAIDASASAAQGGVPELTIGFKRVEAVWMPLYANGAHSTCDGSSTNTGCGSADGPKYIGESGFGARDAYSVFASFGANIEGGAAAETEGKVGLAQFFATGLAAQELARRPSITQALALQRSDAADAGAAAEAGENSAASEALTLARADQIRSRMQYESLAARAALCRSNNNDTDQFQDIDEYTQVNAEILTFFKSQTSDARTAAQ